MTEEVNNDGVSGREHMIPLRMKVDCLMENEQSVMNEC